MARLIALARRTLRGVRVDGRPCVTSVTTPATPTTTIATSSLIRPIGIWRLMGAAVGAAVSTVVLLIRRIGGTAALRPRLIRRTRVLAIVPRTTAIAALLRRTRTSITIRPSALLISILVASRGLGLTLRPAALGRGSAARRLRRRFLFSVVRSSRTARAVVIEPALAFTTRAMRVKLLLGTPRDFTTTGVVLGHEGRG